MPSDSANDVFFCSAFQRSRCQHKYSHSATIQGQLKYCQHVCATCWLKDGNKLAHPESSSACPNKLEN